jgi:signal transduction histidine kinase
MARTLEQRSDYIRAFAANVSHEFKTPLAAMRGTVELLREHVMEMPAEQRERFLSNLAEDADRLDRLVRRLMELARADVLQPAEERAAVKPVLDRVAERYRAQGLALEVSDGECGESVSVRMAPETFDSILSNLLDNARQHGGEGVRVSITSSTVETAAGPAVEVVVRDDGAGISSSNAARVFDAFFTTSRDRGGTGLGLTIIRSLLRACGGTVELLEGSTRGATFRLRIPQQ